jgi:hypothetical protein
LFENKLLFSNRKELNHKLKPLTARDLWFGTLTTQEREIRISEEV